MPGMDAMPMEMGESPGGIDKKLSGNHDQKTRFFIKPNLMQLHSSYVVTDPKGTVLVECGKLLSRGAPKLGKDGKPLRNKKGKIVYEPYQIKVFNTINFKKSMHYNPFAYLHSEKDILKLVTVLIANTKGEGKSGDDFWVKAETLLYTALIGYIYYEAPNCTEKCEAGAVNTDCPVCKNDLNGCLGKVTEEPAPEETEQPEAETEKSSGNTGMIIFLVIALVAAGGLGYYFKIVRPKQQAAMDEDEFEDDGYGEDYEQNLAYSDESSYDEDEEPTKDGR